MNEKKRFAINAFAQIFSFTVSLGITFFLTPYIVGHLGTAAYGFVGLAQNFVSYAQLITIALNSMAGRFISISYHQGNIEQAKKYFTSVFYSNAILLSFVALCSCFVIYRLEHIIIIPSSLLFDVKLLFICVFANFVISVLFNIYNVSTFICNRLELASIRSITANVIKALALVISFHFFSPAVWFVGLATFIASTYTVATNIRLRNHLTPYLIIQKNYFDFTKVKELVSAGVWNVISRLNAILGAGLDLLIANLFIGATPMGILSIVKRLPVLTLSFFENINSIFAPRWTKLYAQNKHSQLKKDISRAIRFFGVISFIPLAAIFAYSDWFYTLWLPSQNAQQFYLLTILAAMDLPFAMPLQPIYNIYPMTNKIKANSLFGVGMHLTVFLCIIIGVNLFDDTMTHLMIIAGTRASFNIIKALTFLPLYGSHCIKMSAKILYKNTFKSVFSFALLLLLLLEIKTLFLSITWINLIYGLGFSFILGSIIGCFIVLNQEDRVLLKDSFTKVTQKITRLF